MGSTVGSRMPVNAAACVLTSLMFPPVPWGMRVDFVATRNATAIGRMHRGAVDAVDKFAPRQGFRIRVGLTEAEGIVMS